MTLHDRDREVLFQASGTGLRVNTVGKSKISPAPDGVDTYYIAGMTAQEARRAVSRELMSRHDALTAAPRPVGISDEQWERTTGSTNPYARVQRDLATGDLATGDPWPAVESACPSRPLTQRAADGVDVLVDDSAGTHVQQVLRFSPASDSTRLLARLRSRGRSP